MGIPLIVKKSFRPNGSGGPEVNPGDPFEAKTAAQVRVYKALGWVVDKPIEVVAAPPAEATKPKWTRKSAVEKIEPLVDTAPVERVTAADVKPAEKAADEFKPRRSYLRRDLTATED